jgi:hypothetical protein
VRRSFSKASALALGIAIIAGTVLSARAEPATLTLACEGATTSWQRHPPNYAEWQKPEPFSGGVVVDFTKKTINGLPYAGDINITEVTETRVIFHKSSPVDSIYGSVDRITGDVEGHVSMNKEFQKKNEPNTERGFNFALKCKPAQRMF